MAQHRIASLNKHKIKPIVYAYRANTFIYFERPTGEISTCFKCFSFAAKQN